jgi:hypothetical protein
MKMKMMMMKMMMKELNEKILKILHFEMMKNEHSENQQKLSAEGSRELFEWRKEQETVDVELKTKCLDF